MNINQKIRIALLVIALLPLNISTSPAIAGIFKCAENTRGLGIVDVAATTSNSVRLEWTMPVELQFRIFTVCYKRAWALSGKCDSKDRKVTFTVPSPVQYANLTIGNLESNKCYKFAVYGTNVDESGRGRLIGEQKTKTD